MGMTILEANSACNFGAKVSELHRRVQEGCRQPGRGGFEQDTLQRLSGIQPRGCRIRRRSENEQRRRVANGASQPFGPVITPVERAHDDRLGVGAQAVTAVLPAGYAVVTLTAVGMEDRK